MSDAKRVAGGSESQSRRWDSLETIFQFKKRTMDKRAVEAPFGNSLDKRFMTSTRASEERDRKVSYGGKKPVTKD